MGRRQILTALLLAGLAGRPLRAADWPQLNQYQQTMPRAEFDRLLATVYCPSGAFTNYLTYTNNAVTVASTPGKTNALFTLRFAATPATSNSPTASLQRIVLDPGHIGGEWARMEERFFVRGKDRPVQEAVLNLTVARLLQQRLATAGATVTLTKDNFQPVTDRRPEYFRAEAVAYAGQLRQFDQFPPLEREAAFADAIRKRQEALFYRAGEIAARARRINTELRPQLTLCLHFNAVEWNEQFDLVDDNRLVVFIHGNYLPAEVADDEQKFRLLAKLLERSHPVELAVANAVADALARATQLPPVQYAPAGSAVRVGTNAYVYARNLAASRLVNGPVVFLEPYYMNNQRVYERIQLGDYTGTRTIDCQASKSIFREYADAVAEGLTRFLKR